MSAITGMPASINQGVSSTGEVDVFERFCVSATNTLAEMLRPLFGPESSSTLVVNELETEHLVFSATTLFEQLKVSNPICRLIERTSRSLPQDGSTHFVLLVCGMLRQALFLLKEGVSRPTVRRSAKQFLRACREVLDTQTRPVFDKTTDEATVLSNFQKVFRAALCKLAHRRVFFESLFFENSAFCLALLEDRLTADSLAVVRKPGVSLADSFLLDGFVLREEFLAKPASLDVSQKVAVFSCSIDLLSTDAKGIVVLQSPEQLLNYSRGEDKLLESKVEALVKLGVGVVLSGGGVSATAVQLFQSFGVGVLSLSSKFDLRRAATLAGADVLTTFDCPSANKLGSAFFESVPLDTVTTTSKTDALLVLRPACKQREPFFTLVLTSPSEILSSKTDKTIKSAFALLTEVRKSNLVLPGGGETETTIVSVLKQHKDFASFAEFLDVLKFAELGVSDNESVLDSASVKMKSYQLAEQVVDDCLIVDDVYFAKPSGGPDVMNRVIGHWDEDEGAY